MNKEANMGTCRQRSGQFFQRLETYRESAKRGSLIRQIKQSDAWGWTEVAAVFIGAAFLVPTAIMFWIDWEDRQTQRNSVGWQLVHRNAPVDSAERPAFDFPESQKISFSGGVLSQVDLPEGGMLKATQLDVDPSGATQLDVDLSGAQLGDANLSGTFLQGANLSGAFLFNTNLSGVNLTDANLAEANLFGSNLSGAKLNAANLSGAYMIIANLSEATLWGADLSGAFLQGSNLSGANFFAGNLSGAYLQGANLAGASLSDVDLSGANLSSSRYLSQNQLDQACGNDKTRLPEGLTVKACSE